MHTSFSHNTNPQLVGKGRKIPVKKVGKHSEMAESPEK
jgi:hypothetical protein